MKDRTENQFNELNNHARSFDFNHVERYLLDQIQMHLNNYSLERDRTELIWVREYTEWLQEEIEREFK